MNDKMIRCVRCHGRKKMYKFNNGYTHANMGAPEVDCPMCLGKGHHKSWEDARESAMNNLSDEDVKKSFDECNTAICEAVEKGFDLSNIKVEKPLLKKDFKHEEKKHTAKKENR